MEDRSHVRTPRGVHHPERVGEQDGEPVYQVQKLSYSTVRPEEMPPDPLRLADGLAPISGPLTVDLDPTKWDANLGRALPNPDYDFPTDRSKGSLLRWLQARLDKRWPKLADRWLVEKFAWRVSPGGHGIHLKVVLKVKKTPKARYYTGLDPLNVFEVRRALGDDPKRWLYDLKRAHADPGSINGWLADANRRGSAGKNPDGTRAHEWQRGMKWEKVC